MFTTPAWAVDAVLPHLPLAGVVVDAGCGEGAILSRVAARGASGYLVGVECDVGRAATAETRVREAARNQSPVRICDGDWLTFKNIGRVDLCIFNPPFGLAEEFIEHACELTAPTNGTVAALLRFNWGIPACREAISKRHPFDLGFLRRRCDFVASLKCGATPRCAWKTMQPIDAARPKGCPGCGGKILVVTTDSSDYAWHLIGPGRGGRFFALDIPERAASAISITDAMGGR
jgi:SAM-dependent methyltransferase